MSADTRGTGGIAMTAVRESFGDAKLLGEPKLLAGGAMHDSWAVDAHVDDADRQFVVRVSPAGRADHQKTRREYEVLRVAFARGVACPAPIAVGVCDSGEDYLLMARVHGDTNPRKIIGDPAYKAAREAMIDQLAGQLAAIHRMSSEDVAAAPDMRGPAAGEDPLRYERRIVEDVYRQTLLNPHPAIDWAFRWIDRRIASLPSSGRARGVVHGDFRIGNMLYDESGLTAILDWEGVHIGEPEEDLSWLCTRVWRFGRPDLEAGGIGSREKWLAAYERASGQPVDRERVAAWEVLQNIRWAQITMMQARAHLDGHTRNHELAAIGRRTAETELEILRLAGVRERVVHAG